MKYILIIASIVVLGLLSPFNKQKIKVGECYAKTFKSKDPFFKPPIDTIKIIGVNNGYYEYTFLINNRTLIKRSDKIPPMFFAFDKLTKISKNNKTTTR